MTNLHLTYYASDPVETPPDVTLVSPEHQNNPFVLLGVALGCVGSFLAMVWKGITGL